ncbi:MAG: sigma-70 family RNA polymerase sigma factor [Crocinitomicaceae bacterium]|nr:sigma-70 family RNA polymerase sigma factor [Crocinitomicaceae bacterium]
MALNSMYHQTKDRLQEELTFITKAKQNPESFGPLYTKYHEQIFRYVYQRMNDEELAFDVTSQVFIKAMNNLHKYEYRGVPFSSWLYRIAKSELYQAFRDKKARKTVSVASMQLFEMIEEFEEDDSSKNKKKLFQCLSLLKEDDLELIELRYFEKRSYREIGEIIEITENNAKVRTFRALERLKKLFMK